ncbi:hypothetical protein AB205_0062700 [Aquarana catesbeiana]|uniref:Uncharacterized protein n=1 Tax=Aquarana catesbeiana TaxID=8400 RepID=A0A2G9P2Z0_AQUCT|nr:hypothetical protein AB205_0062700 [Aquarana catesbeiana]
MCPQWSPSLHQVPPTESLHTSGAPSLVPFLHQVPPAESLVH